MLARPASFWPQELWDPDSSTLWAAWVNQPSKLLHGAYRVCKYCKCHPVTQSWHSREEGPWLVERIKMPSPGPCCDVRLLCRASMGRSGQKHGRVQRCKETQTYSHPDFCPMRVISFSGCPENIAPTPRAQSCMDVGLNKRTWQYWLMQQPALWGWGTLRCMAARAGLFVLSLSFCTGSPNQWSCCCKRLQTNTNF